MENNDLECPNCGASVYYELTRCPKCGWNFYDADANEAFEPARQEPWWDAAWVGSLKAVLSGWLAAAAVTFALHYSISRIYAPETLNLPAQAILFFSGPLGALAGGYLAGALAKRRQAGHGLAVGMLTIGAALLLETHWHEVTTAFLLQPAAWLNWIVTVLAGIAGEVIYTRSNEQAALPRWIVTSEEDLYRNLLAKVRSNPETAERLIAFERQKAPQAGRRMLIQNAIERWLRDNR